MCVCVYLFKYEYINFYFYQHKVNIHIFYKPKYINQYISLNNMFLNKFLIFFLVMAKTPILAKTLEISQVQPIAFFCTF